MCSDGFRCLYIENWIHKTSKPFGAFSRNRKTRKLDTNHKIIFYSFGCPHFLGNGRPQSSGFPPNELVNVPNCVPDGIRPIRWFCERFKNLRNFNSARLLGISPLSLFQDRSKYSISERFPKTYGIRPVRLLWDRSSTLSEVR